MENVSARAIEVVTRFAGSRAELATSPVAEGAPTQVFLRLVVACVWRVPLFYRP
jgi:hypothetical protein